MITSTGLTIDNYATFVFHSSTGAGYELYMSYDSVTFTKVETRVDGAIMRDRDISTTSIVDDDFFNHQISGEAVNGRALYFIIQRLNASQVVGTSTAITEVHTYPSTPQNIKCYYNGYRVKITWDHIDFTNDNNWEFTEYKVYKSSVEGVSGSEIDDDNDYLLTNTEFSVGDVLWVVDSIKKLEWYGVVTTEGEFDLTDSGILDANLTTNIEKPFINNIEVRRELQTKTYVGSTLNNYYDDTSFTSGAKFIYNVAAATSFS